MSSLKNSFSSLVTFFDHRKSVSLDTERFFFRDNERNFHNFRVFLAMKENFEEKRENSID